MIVLLVIGCRPVDEVALPDGTEVVLDEGRVEIRTGGRTTLALAGPPVALSFDEAVTSNLGQYAFDRTDEVRRPLAPTGIDLDGDAAVIPLNGGQMTIASDGPGATRVILSATDPADALAVPLRCDLDGSFHGFGAQYQQTNQHGEAFSLLVGEQGIGRDGAVPFYSGDAHTTYFPMPWFLDARGFGVLVDTRQRVEVDLCRSDPDIAWIEVVHGDPLELLVMHGPAPLDVLQQLGDRVGRPAVPPDWAYGTWICTQGGEVAVLAQADLLEAEEIPASVLWVQDWTGAAVNLGGGYGVNYRWAPDDGGAYPDLPGLVANLHARDLKVVGYVNPFVDPALPDHYDDMVAQGLLPLDGSGDPYLFFGPRGQMTQADLTNPATRDYIAAYLRTAVTDVGLDGWMADFAEWLPLDAVLSDGSDPVAAHNGAPAAWEGITRGVMDELRPDGDWVMFARSGWTGVHEVAQIHWVGDQEADFSPTDGLPTVVPAMINLGLSGQPHVTHDIAGFSGGPSGEELYLRWTELGAFSPHMRTHDGNARDQNWRFDTDAATLAFFRRMARIHDVLAPELMQLAAEAGQTSAPLVRHLLIDFPDDPEVVDLFDQYLLGPDLLVAPILHEGWTDREVYFPAGDWFDVWTGEARTGPGWQTVPGPLGSPPVFARGADRTDLRSVE